LNPGFDGPLSPPPLADSRYTFYRRAARGRAARGAICRQITANQRVRPAAVAARRAGGGFDRASRRRLIPSSTTERSVNFWGVSGAPLVGPDGVTAGLYPANDHPVAMRDSDGQRAHPAHPPPALAGRSRLDGRLIKARQRGRLVVERSDALWLRGEGETASNAMATCIGRRRRAARGARGDANRGGHIRR